MVNDTKKHEGTYIEINKLLIKDIKEYCSLNDLKLTDFINSLLKDAFMKEKYGDSPFDMISGKQEVEVVKINEMEYHPEPEIVPVQEIVQKPDVITVGKTKKKIKTF